MRSMASVGVLGLIVAAAGVGAGQAPATRAADLALVGGRIYTVDNAKPWAEAVALTNDRIVAVGTNAEIRALAGPDTRVIDLQGAFVTPGFNDAHVHVESTGALLTGANLLDVHDEARFRQRIAEAVARVPPGAWITRGDWGAY
jgi:predicted amidohydrolase YtcJ